VHVRFREGAWSAKETEPSEMNQSGKEREGGGLTARTFFDLVFVFTRASSLVS
jgi:hypothetical protein